MQVWSSASTQDFKPPDCKVRWTSLKEWSKGTYRSINDNYPLKNNTELWLHGNVSSHRKKKFVTVQWCHCNQKFILLIQIKALPTCPFWSWPLSTDKGKGGRGVLQLSLTYLSKGLGNGAMFTGAVAGSFRTLAEGVGSIHIPDHHTCIIPELFQPLCQLFGIHTKQRVMMMMMIMMMALSSHTRIWGKNLISHFPPALCENGH